MITDFIWKIVALGTGGLAAVLAISAATQWFGKVSAERSADQLRAHIALLAARSQAQAGQVTDAIQKGNENAAAAAAKARSQSQAAVDDARDELDKLRIAAAYANNQVAASTDLAGLRQAATEGRALLEACGTRYLDLARVADQTHDAAGECADRYDSVKAAFDKMRDPEGTAQPE